MKNGKKIGILVVAYNAVSTLTKVLDRIPKNVYDEIDEIAVFDDASKDETYMVSVGYKEVRKFEKLNIFLNEKNLGYGGNQKRGFKYFISRGFDAVVLLHGDGQYAPEVLAELYNPIIEDNADVVLGSRMMKKYGGALKGGMPFYKFVGNKILSSYQNFTLGMNLTEFHSGYRAYSVSGLKKINLDNCTDDFHFDTQIIIKSHHNNLKIVEVPIPTFYGGEICYVNGMRYAKDIYRTTKNYKKTIKGKKKDDSYREYYVRYPVKLYPFSSHYEILKILNSKNNLDILEIGYGDGLLLKNMKSDNKIVCFGMNEENENSESVYNRYFRFDLHRGLPDLPELHKKFDYILLLDIIEHLLGYQKILEDAPKYLNENGIIVLSIPNFVNIYVRLNLLIGRIPYTDRGLFDKNHIRIFNYKNAKKLLGKFNYKIEKIFFTPIPVIEVLPKSLKKNVGLVMNFILFLKAKILKRLFTYQFIFLLKNKN
ncbi:MAG: glycosyltransferase [Ignavibacteria bacterium]|nr:glycosyltransferase [Ignavibacteria bacterium]